MMAQVEMQCGPFTVVSLMSADAVARARARAGQRRRRRRQGHHRDRRNPWRAIVKQFRAAGRLRCAAASASSSGCGSSDQARRQFARPRRPAGGKIMVFAAASLKTDVHRASVSSSRPTTPARQSSSLRGFVGSGDPVDPGRPGRRLRLRRHQQHGQGRAGRPAGGRPGELRVQHAHNRRRAGQSEEDRLVQGPDTARPDVVVCAPQVPCGSATQKVEQATGVTLNPVSEESRLPTSSTR